VALALKIAADGDEAKTCLGVADEVDAHRAYRRGRARGEDGRARIHPGRVRHRLGPAAKRRRSRPGEWRDRRSTPAAIAPAAARNAREDDPLVPVSNSFAIVSLRHRA